MINAWRLAIRDLRAGGRGLWLLLLCLFLGTAALAGIGSLSSSITAALQTQSRQLLGGDLELRVSQRRPTVEESATFATYGRTSESVSVNTMAQSPTDGASTLINLRAVDHNWPLIGRLELKDGALASRPGGRTVAIAAALADRLHVRVGDRIRIGSTWMQVIGVIAGEPDTLGFSFGPTALVDMDGLDATGVIQPGSLFQSRTRILLRRGLDRSSSGNGIASQYPSGGWEVRTPEDAAGNVKRSIDQLGQFLLLVGLAALAIAGIGIGSGVSAYLQRKGQMIATLKVLGARSALISTVFLLQVGLVAALGVFGGLVIGAAMPWIVARLAGEALPVPPQLALYPAPLLSAAGLSLLVALLFSFPALSRARDVPAASLLRDKVSAARRPRAVVAFIMGVVLAAIVALAVMTSSNRTIALGFVAATGALVALLWLLGIALRFLLSRLPRPRQPLLRLALANLYRPGAQTDRLVVALGLGFSLFVALAAIDSSLSNELASAAPAKAPRFFAIDLQPDDEATFRKAVSRAAPTATIEVVPSLRGSIVALKQQRVVDMRSLPEGAWILRGDRTITWSAALPPRNTVVEGAWWPANYRGPPLISLEDRAAKLLGLKVGDVITVAVLGVEINARIAALRQVDWQGLGLNFALIFSPGYIEEAPHSLLASVYAPSDSDGALASNVADSLPSVTMLRTGDVIGQISELLGRIALAIRAAAAITVAAGIIVLIGAVSASGHARRYDTIVLKLLGGSRRQLLVGQAIEYGLLALILAVVALVLGMIAGWYVVTQVLELKWAPDPITIAGTLGASTLMTLTVGLASSVPALRAPAAAALRSS